MTHGHKHNKEHKIERQLGTNTKPITYANTKSKAQGTREWQNEFKCKVSKDKIKQRKACKNNPSHKVLPNNNSSLKEFIVVNITLRLVHKQH